MGCRGADLPEGSCLFGGRGGVRGLNIAPGPRGWGIEPLVLSP